MAVEEARARVLAGVFPLPGERIPVGVAFGRVLAAPLAALRSQPPFDASAMDGYAVRAEDATQGAALRLVGASVAGRRYDGAVGPGETVRIFTGAPVPPGADAVLLQEDASAKGERVTVKETVRRGRHIRRAGLDFHAGEAVFEAGRLLSPRDVALIAALGHAEVEVVRRPRVAILATGDELVPPGATPGPDQIVASNHLAIAALLKADGAEAVDLGIAPDDLAAIKARIEAARSAGVDLLVTLGGASVGDRDLVREALGETGLELDFWKIAMRPGKPMMFGRLGTLAVLGLPGNPVSSHVCALLFLRPLVRALSGRRDLGPVTSPAVLGTDVAANDHRQDHLRATVQRIDGRDVVTPVSVQDSSMQRPLALADALILRMPHAPAAKAGDACEILRLDAQA